jgi:hypothetical protein
VRLPPLYSLQTRAVLRGHRSQDLKSSRPVISRCRRDPNDQRQAQHAHNDMPLSPGDFLTTVKTWPGTDLGPLNRLAITLSGTGRWLPSPHRSCRCLQSVEDLLPGAVVTLLSEAIIDGALG